MNDTSLMPFGKYKGKRLIDVPGSWFLWWLDQNPQNYPALRKYAEDNKEAFKKEK